MKTIFQTFTFRFILLSGIIVGVVKGQDAKQKWVAKKKTKFEARKAQQRHASFDQSLVMLDEIEMLTYHS